MIVGVSDFSLGETRTRRVGPNGPRMRCMGGYNGERGCLTADKLPTRVSTSALSGTTPAQIPLPFRDADGVRLVCRDANNYLRVMGTDGVWGDPVSWLGSWKEASMGTVADNAVITCYDHGFEDNDPVQFENTDVGVTAGTTYYADKYSDDLFYISATPGGAHIDVYGGALNNVALEHTPTFDMESDSAPFRLNELTVWPTKDGIMCFEPDSTGTMVRPLSLRGPQWYVDKTKATVSASSPHPGVGAELFDLVAAGTHFEHTAAGGYNHVITVDDHEELLFSDDAGPSDISHTYDVGDAGISLQNKKYLIVDLSISYTAFDPVTAMVIGGVFVNADQTPLASGWEFGFYTERPGHGGYDTDHELRVHAIPQIVSDGRISKVAIHLGDSRATAPWGGTFDAASDTITSTAHGLAVNETITFAATSLGVTAGVPYYVKSTPSADTFTISATLGGATLDLTGDGYKTWTVNVKTIAVLTSENFVSPAVDQGVNLHLYSADFAADWKAAGNVLLPAAVNKDAPWYSLLPPNPGEQGHSATVLWVFPGSFTSYAPDMPKVKYAYAFRGRDRLSTSYYKTLISDPSEETAAQVYDPWLYYDIAATLPENADGEDAIEQFGDYLTHGLFHRQIYQGVTVGGVVTSGAWGAWEYIGYDDIALSMSYRDAGKEDEACTVDDATDTVTSTDHNLNAGDAITFGETTGGVALNTRYFVLSSGLTANAFKFSETPGGTAFDISAAGSNTWTKAPAELTIDDKDIPAVMEANHGESGSARYAGTMGDRVYAFCRNYDSSSSTWLRPRTGMASNVAEHGSFPEIPDEADVTQGGDLEEYSPTAYSVSGLLPWQSRVVVLTDVGLFPLLGTSHNTWRFLEGSAVPCRSGRGIAAFPDSFIYPGPDGFYLSDSGKSVLISDDPIDYSLIDWTEAHGAVCSGERYIFFCTYDDSDQDTAYCRMIYDRRSKSWRRHHSTAYNLAGICVDKPTGTVYGLTVGGDVVNLFGGTACYGDTEATYNVWTEDLILCPPTETRTVSHIVANLRTDQSSIEVELQLFSEGIDDGTIVDSADRNMLQTVTSGKSQYRWPIGAVGDAVGVRMLYRGAYPPDIHFLGIRASDAVTS